MPQDNISSENMTTSSQVLERLRQKNMNHEFKWTPQGFTADKGKFYQPEDLEILKTYRFEGDSNPSDTEILYIIHAKHDGLTGYSQDAYGVYTSHEKETGYDNFIRQISEAGHDDQLLFEL